MSTVLLVSCSKNNGVSSTPAVVPSVKVSNATVKRTNSTATCQFFVDLSATSTKKISVHYNTTSGTAIGGKDFTPVSGTLTFKPGTQELSVNVPILVDSLRQANQTFTMQLTKPFNCTISVNQGTGTIINNGTYLPTDTTGYQSPTSYSGYKLVWSDEFSGKTLNTNEWNYETGGGGWGNNELEYYTSRTQNLFLSQGNLIIEARKENYGGNKYTSARITTQGKESFTYGRVDIRAKLPVAHGMWPALWMLGNSISKVGWPACGEIDIMELIGSGPNQVHGSYHWKLSTGAEGNFTKTYTLQSGDFSQKFHVYSLVWTPDSLKILIDNKPYSTVSKQQLGGGTYPFSSPFFFIFNVAVGGNWPGPPDSTTKFPQFMYVDYIRVFQKVK